MKTIGMNIRGVDYSLRLDMAAYQAIEEQDWEPILTDGQELPATGYERMRMCWADARTSAETSIRLFAILANNARDAMMEEYAARGEKVPEDMPGRLSPRMLKRQLTPGMMVLVDASLMAAFKTANRVTHDPDDESEDYDAILAELERKKAEAAD